MTDTTTFLQREGIGIHQHRKIFELRNQYTLVDRAGERIGSVEQVGQSPVAVLARIVSDLDMMLPSTLAVHDETGDVVLELHKPWFRTEVTVRRSDGAEIGRIRKQIRLGKARFSLFGASGEDAGEVRARNWRAKNFEVRDAAGREVAHVTKQWRGLFTEAFTDADSYAVEFASHADETMRGLAFASALAVDIVMKQKDE